ncbi:MAG: quinone oxidoreductase family protein [Janthinobacterium lividum]
MKAIRLESYGGPEVLRYVDVEMPLAGPAQIVVRNHAIGLNFLETRQRRGDYPLPLPGGIGVEAAGIVESVGPGVTAFSVGDRVAYMNVYQGADAEATLVRADRAFKLPEAISFEAAAASTIKGMTAAALLKRTFKVAPGTDVLIWAAAGGMGQHLVQWAAHLGARIIAVVGSDAKVPVAQAAGAHHVLVSSRDDVSARVRELTDGNGVAVVYDAIGKDTAEASMNSLAPLGMFVNYGSISGHPDPVQVTDLSDKGSLFYTRAVLYTYIRTPALFQEVAADLVDALSRGIVKLPPPRTYRLADIGQAHRDIASRETTGSLVLIP